jgi:hypothetical protein
MWAKTYSANQNHVGRGYRDRSAPHQGQKLISMTLDPSGRNNGYSCQPCSHVLKRKAAYSAASSAG